MHLLHLTLQPPTAITESVYGNFSSSKAQEFAVSRGNTLELLRPDDNGKLHTIYSTKVFGVIRSLLPFRLTGSNKDYLVVGSDSGKITVLEFDSSLNRFKVCHSETYGKTGCRRITPGQYLAADPKGRAIMIGAIEKQKLVYVMNRDASNRLTISSPLEAHRSQAILYDIAGLDVGFDNPVFACLELNYADADADPTGEAAKEAHKSLVFYELDLGLNHVTRRWSDRVFKTANKLVAVPGGGDGPGGVLICCENWICYKNEGHKTLRTLIPRRKRGIKKSLEGKEEEEDQLERGLLIVSSSTHKQRDLFFILLQSELGDIYKVSLDYEADAVAELHVKFFDTIPTSASICITKTGFLFSASEYSNHYLFQFQGIGDGDETAECVSYKEEEQQQQQEEDIEECCRIMSDASISASTSRFSTRKLTNLVLVDELSSLAPITDMYIGDLVNEEETPQIYTLCGRGNRSSLRILRHGLAMTEMAVSELPGNPTAVWCIKNEQEDDVDKYIVVSFINATLVLSIGESVEEVLDSGFTGDVCTLNVVLLQDDTILQVHSNGIRHIQKSNSNNINKSVTEWKAPGKKRIEKCAVNTRQVVIALAGGEVIYFELEGSALVEKTSIELGIEIACLDIGVVPEGRTRFPFLAVGGYDNTVRILSLDPADLMKQKSTQALEVHAEALAIVEMINTDSSSSTSSSTSTMSKSLYLNVGLHNGVFQRTEMDRITGGLSNSRSRFLGTKPVKLFRLTVQGNSAILAVSSRSWLAYPYQSRFNLTPLSYEMIQYASSFSSEQCSEGIVAIAENTLRIIAVDRLGEVFNQQKVMLTYTPRKFIVHPTTKRLIIIESDHNTYSKQVLEKNKVEEDVEMVVVAKTEEEEEEEEEEEQLPLQGPVPTTSGTWASCIRLFDPIECRTVSCIDLDENEAAISIGNVVFHDRGGEVFVVVGTVVSMDLHHTKSSSSNNNSATSYLLRVYRVVEGEQLVLVHITPVENLPYAIASFQGRALISIGPVLRIYDLGKRKLLRKCENKNFPTMITKINTAGDRIYVGDMNESFHFVKYKREENQLVIFADDYVPRFITSQVLLDYDTIAGGDKFGNLFVSRVPSEVSDEADNNPTGNRMLWDTGLLNGAPNKLELVSQFHTGELITCLTRSSLVVGGSEALVYATVMGTIGALVPFTSREDLDFYSHLEMYMRQENTPLCGRDHLAYRSYFIPMKDVSDGDLCEQYSNLSLEKQKTIAGDLDRQPNEVIKKLEDVRNRLM